MPLALCNVPVDFGLTNSHISQRQLPRPAPLQNASAIDGAVLQWLRASELLRVKRFRFQRLGLGVQG